MPRAPGTLSLAAALTLAAAGPTAVGQEPAPPKPPSFAAGIDVVLVNAVVTDRQGRPVEGLTADDFLVLEDGEPQALTSFEAVVLPPAPPVARATAPAKAAPADEPSRASTNQEPPDPSRRVFLVVLDDGGLGLDGAAAAKRVAKRFLAEAARPGDLVSLVAPAAGITWSTRHPEGTDRLAAVLDSIRGQRAMAPELTSAWEASRVADGLDPLAQERARVRLDASGLLPREPRFPGESDEAYDARNRALQNPFVSADSRRQLDLDRDRRRELFAATAAALDAVASVKGRKSVLLFSEGVIREPHDPPFRELVGAARRSDAAFYHVNVARLRSGMAADSRQAGDRSASTRVADANDSGGADQLAEETGGFALANPNDLEAGLERIAREAASHYRLGYTPTNPSRDGGYRRIQVELRRAGLEVRARKGYFSPSDEAPPRAAAKKRQDPELERALTGAVPAAEMPLRLAAVALQPVGKGKLRVRLVGEVGLEPSRFPAGDGGARTATLDVAMALNHAEPAGRLRTPWRELEIGLPEPAEGRSVWVPLEGEFDVPAGACQARLAVRDRASGALGSVVHELELPDPSSWRVSTPILSDVPDEERGRAPRLQLGRSFVAGSPLYCYLEVYDGPARKKRGRAPRVTLAYSLLDAQGKTRKSQPEAPLGVGPSGFASRLETIPLTGLKPGEYELRLSVRDEAAGRTQELRESFTVRRPSRPDLAIYVELLQAYRDGELARATAGVLEWRPEDLATLAKALPPQDLGLRRAALSLHTAIALRLWSNARGPEAEAQIAVARAALAKDAPAELHRDWLLALGYYRLDVGSPLTALPFFEECKRRFPAVADAWLGAGICHELSAIPGGFALTGVTEQGGSRQAERSYREAVRLDPRLAEARLRLGRVLLAAKAFDEAERELAAAVAASADAAITALARVFWGGVRDARGDLAGATAHYQAALAADPECETAAFALGEALVRSGRRRDAAEVLARVLQASRSTEPSPWHAYHVGAQRWKALLSVPQPLAPLAAAAPASETP